MPKQRIREISSGPARCRRCRAISVITVRETRYVRSWGSMLDRDFDPSPVRTAHCPACGVTYPIRSADGSAAAATSRRDEVDLPRSREWAYAPRDERRAPGR